MKIRKSLLIASAIPVLSLPIASQAATDKDAMEACSQALVEHIEETRGTVVKLKIANLDAARSMRLDGSLIYHLDARVTDSNEVVARADCVVNRYARVKDLRTLPLTAKNADERT